MPVPPQAKGIAAFAVLLCLSLSLCIPASYPADKEAEKKLKEIQEELSRQKRKLGDIVRFESSVLGELEKTNDELLAVENDLRRQKALLRETAVKISKLNTEVSEIHGRLGKRKDWMRRKLRAVYRYGNLGDAILLISSSENVSQIMRRLEYLRRLAKYENKVIEGFKADLAALGERKSLLEALYAKQGKQKADIGKTAESLERRKAQKREQLASVKKERAAYERLVREMEEASQKLMEIIRKSEEGEAAAGSGFRARRGRLDWPVKGVLAIPYGKQKDPQFNTAVFRNGIYLKTQPGVTVKSIYPGKVVFAEWFKGYGQLVIVNHGEGYHSLYANLSEIFLGVGDIIEEDVEIGRVGETVILNAPSLYFEIRYKGKPLDPMQWLARR